MVAQLLVVRGSAYSSVSRYRILSAVSPCARRPSDLSPVCAPPSWSTSSGQTLFNAELLRANAASCLESLSCHFPAHARVAEPQCSQTTTKITIRPIRARDGSHRAYTRKIAAEGRTFLMRVSTVLTGFDKLMCGRRIPNRFCRPAKDANRFRQFADERQTFYQFSHKGRRSRIIPRPRSVEYVLAFTPIRLRSLRNFCLVVRFHMFSASLQGFREPPAVIFKR